MVLVAGCSIQITGTSIKCKGIFLCTLLQRQLLHTRSQRQFIFRLRDRDRCPVVCLLLTHCKIIVFRRNYNLVTNL